jgi:hypothetical protein
MKTMYFKGLQKKTLLCRNPGPQVLSLPFALEVSMKQVLSDKYVIADTDEATSYRDLDEVARDFEELGDTVVFDKRKNIVAVITTTSKKDEKFSALVVYFEKLTIGTRRLAVRYDRYVIANVGEETIYKDLDQVRTDEELGVFLADTNRQDMVIVLKILSGIRGAIVFHLP